MREEGRGYPQDFAPVMGPVPSLSWDLVFGHKREDLISTQRANPRPGPSPWVLPVPRQVLGPYSVKSLSPELHCLSLLSESTSLGSAPEFPKRQVQTPEASPHVPPGCSGKFLHAAPFLCSFEAVGREPGQPPASCSPGLSSPGLNPPLLPPDPAGGSRKPSGPPLPTRPKGTASHSCAHTSPAPAKEGPDSGAAALNETARVPALGSGLSCHPADSIHIPVCLHLMRECWCM